MAPAHHSSNHRCEVVPISHIVFTDFWGSESSNGENSPSHSSSYRNQSMSSPGCHKTVRAESGDPVAFERNLKRPSVRVSTIRPSGDWVRAAVLETDSYLQRPDVQLEYRCSLNGSP